MPTLAKSIITLRNQVNKAHPNRSKASDGTWPSSQHRKQNPHSDHDLGNALDLTNDPAHGFSSEKFAEHLRQSRDPRLKYVISNRKIASAKTGWRWAKYNGANPHDKHVHVSVNRSNDSDKPWLMPAAPVGIAALEPEPVLDPNLLPQQADEEGTAEMEMVGQGNDERTAIDDERDFPEGQTP